MNAGAAMALTQDFARKAHGDGAAIAKLLGPAVLDALALGRIVRVLAEISEPGARP